MHIRGFSLLIGISLGFFFRPAWGKENLERFSVRHEDMQKFVQQCVQLPSESSMEDDLKKWMAQNRESSSMNLTVSLDGFPFQNLNEKDFKAVRDLTIYREAHGRDQKDYDFQMKKENGTMVVERTCRKPSCLEKGPARKFDLSSFWKTGTSICSDSLCGMKKIFGNMKGVFILWSYMKFGSNLSPMSDINSDPDGLSESTMRAVLSASLLNPDHLRDFLFRGTGFFRYPKGFTLPMYKGKKVVANSFGGVFDPIDEMDQAEKIYFFLHELGHRARLKEKPSLDESADWTAIHENGAASISKYAVSNPFEDFAESYALYRLNPTRLKNISPERYEFMRQRVFDGIEYTQDLCRGNRASSVARHP